MHVHVKSMMYDAKALMQNTGVRTRHVQDNLHKHTCKLVKYMPNLVNMQVDVYKL